MTYLTQTRIDSGYLLGFDTYGSQHRRLPHLLPICLLIRDKGTFVDMGTFVMLRANALLLLQGTD